MQLLSCNDCIITTFERRLVFYVKIVIMIILNEVTRFSKIVAVIVFIATWLVGFYIGKQFEYLSLNSEPSLATKVNEIAIIDPTITQIITSSDMSNYNELTQSSYRLIVKNTEYDPCLYLDEVTVNVETGPKLIRTQKLCSVGIDDNTIDLTEGQAFVGYENIVWEKGKLTFDLDLGSDEPLECAIDDVEQAAVMGDSEGVSIMCVRP